MAVEQKLLSQPIWWIISKKLSEDLKVKKSIYKKKKCYAYEFGPWTKLGNPWTVKKLNRSNSWILFIKLQLYIAL